MSVSKPFRFKQFVVHQDRCAMKVGTDGVLLGAWAKADSPPTRILDIGSGTGLIALMMAQKFPNAQIDAVEIVAEAHTQCAQNFLLSPWKNRLTAWQADVRNFLPKDAYQLILSNPPFYTETSFSSRQDRQIARSTDALSYEDLLYSVSRMLSKEGSFQAIIPFKETRYFLEIAAASGLFPQCLTQVRGRADKPVKRSLIALGFTQKPFLRDEVIIEISRHHYTAEYIRLTQDFYLGM